MSAFLTRWQAEQERRGGAYSQRFLQPSRPVIEAVQHQVLPHAVNPLPARRHGAAHKLGSLLSARAERLHGLRKKRARCEVRPSLRQDFFGARSHLTVQVQDDHGVGVVTDHKVLWVLREGDHIVDGDF